MGDGGTRAGIGTFRTEEARTRFLAAYDEAFYAWPLPRTEVDVTTDFGTTHVHRSGPEAGEPVVLLHGHGANASNWAPQIAALAARHPVYAVDTIDDPGRSVQTAPISGSADAARWLGQVLAGLGLDRVHLVGHSYGGWLTLNQAAHGPERLATATVLDPGGLQKVRAKFYFTMIGGALAAAAPRRTRPWFADKLANHALVMDPRMMAPVMIGARSFGPQRSAARPFTDDELRSIGVPLLVLNAARSTLLHPAPALERALSLVLRAEGEVVPGVGHGLSFEDPDYVNDRILKFVESERD
ncbi:alpha/beta fold hydrolase [Yinghuangia soli]|uniref:Alpha/beta fold hydrolase n=1 Tax=Yinghuangia soli TaxID=2908204 RepID=A0AA41PWK6_9ACTN|nr:alpha/beta fold hydrolase [Yinghuangia soli]MCF2527058.1 alpha/beta fold hydrolase [Yinghuangia soli]